MSVEIQSIPLPEKFDLLNLHAAEPTRYPFLLESVAQSDTLGQYDILFAFPQQTLTCQTKQDGEGFYQAFQSAFKDVQAKINQDFSVPENLPGLPFMGGWFSYFGYDYAQVVEPSLDLPCDASLPLAVLVRMPAALIIDKANLLLHFMTETGVGKDSVDAEMYLKTMQADALQYGQQASTYSAGQAFHQTEEADAKFLNGVAAIKEYILAGDVFQVNLSREWQVAGEQVSAISLYQALRQSNPAPFAALAHFGDWQILSSSPERLVKYQAPWVETRPIAGTRKRSAIKQADEDLMAELIAHPKERAEHIMLIDLERNDLGRICQPGTVEVNELMVVETYEHVHHIVSNIRGKLQAGLNPLDIIHAVFPGGTITGCPKIRCMEIIAELEKMPRKAYTGSVGYINRDGSLDTNILIRTILKQHETLSFRAGAGIVADSVAQKELQETCHKAKGMLNAFVELEAQE